MATVPPPTWEVELFRLLNDLPHDNERLLWPVQQLGMALAIPAGALVLGVATRSALSAVVLMLLATTLGWGVANMMREIVGRGRPSSLLDNVQLGYDVPAMGNAFPSGHAIVVMTLLMVLAPYASQRLIVVGAGLAVIAMLARSYVGAHMPLDLVGGAAFGVAIGATVNLITGVMDRSRAEMRGSDG